MSPFEANRHAVFEASAGTGKTFNIVEYVLWSVEQGISLDQVLLVTFTEKAAGELKQRVRRGLEARLAAASDGARLRQALEGFDNAQIFTIHGFCQRVLRQNPLAGVSAKVRMVSDSDIAETCLREFQRQEWTRRYKTDLLPVLEISGYCEAESGGQKWERNARAVLAQFKPECGHVLLPEDNSADNPATLETRLRGILEDFENNIGAIGPKLKSHPIVADYNKNALHWKSRESRREKLLLPLLQLTRSRWTEPDVLLAFQDLVESLRKYSPYRDSGFQAVAETDDGNLKGLTGYLEDFTRAMDEFCADFARFKFRLSTETVRGVLETQRRYKQERGLQSYDDLLTQVHAAIFQSENGPELVETLRRQYRVAIVDEFQDTDPVQWQIFERIFLQAPGKQHALIIVGDPKQAIYSFRSADVNAYLQAREAVLKQNGLPRPLHTCFRTSAEMNRALNAFFETGALLSGGDIKYSPVAIPENDCPRLDKDESRRRALTVLEFGEDVAMADARAQTAEFIAAECARLLSGRAIHFTRPKKESRDLRASDIAVLFFRRSEAAPVEDALRKRGIPYTFYKKSQMWSSDESVQMWYLLSALAEPENRAAWRKMLLTRLFGVRAAELRAFDEVSPEHPFMGIVQRWRELCARREWAELFRSMLEDTGLLADEARQPDGSRRVANWRFITQSLAQDAYARGLDIVEVRELLRERRQLPAFDDSNLHPLETEQPTVKLMTVFASKGLEFPVVFLAGGFSEAWRKPEFFKYHDDNGRVVYDFDAGDEQQRRSKAEEEQEQQRLYYVAMTRAMFKLYVPTQSDQPANPKKSGKARKWNGTLRKLLQPCIQRALAGKPEDIGVLSAESALKEPAPEFVVEEKSAAGIVALPAKLLVEAELPPLAARRLRTHSYSGLVHAKKGASLRLDELERAPREDDDDAEVLKPDALPPGAASGPTRRRGCAACCNRSRWIGCAAAWMNFRQPNWKPWPSMSCPASPTSKPSSIN